MTGKFVSSQNLVSIRVEGLCDLEDVAYTTGEMREAALANNQLSEDVSVAQLQDASLALYHRPVLKSSYRRTGGSPFQSNFKIETPRDLKNQNDSAKKGRDASQPSTPLDTLAYRMKEDSSMRASHISTSGNKLRQRRDNEKHAKECMHKINIADLDGCSD